MIFDKLFKKDKVTAEEKHAAQNSKVDYYAEGVVQFNAGHYTQAMEYFQAAIEENPANSEAYIFLSDCYFKIGRTRQSQTTLYSLLSKDPDNQQAKQRLNKFQTIETGQNEPSQNNQSSSQPGNISTCSTTQQVQSKNQAIPTNCKQATKSKWEWTTGNIISGIIGLIILILSIFGIIGCLPLDGEPLDNSFEWAYLSLFILLSIFSTCMTLSPRLKPSWKVKDIILSILGLILTPICIGMLVDDFDKNDEMILMGIFSLVFVFAPFIKTN